MNLRTITLLTAIAQSLACLLNGASFVSFAYEVLEYSDRRPDDIMSFISWPVHVVAQAVFAFFLFFLFAKQRDN
ncbi:MAG: hypothetical protein ACLP1Y_08215 [Candidatus Acidiferrales bacterium]